MERNAKEAERRLKELADGRVENIGTTTDPHFAVEGITMHFSALEEFEAETGFDVKGVTKEGITYFK